MPLAARTGAHSSSPVRELHHLPNCYLTADAPTGSSQQPAKSSRAWRPLWPATPTAARPNSDLRSYRASAVLSELSDTQVSHIFQRNGLISRSV